VIDYQIDGVLEPGTPLHDGEAAPRTQLYWNLIPSGWLQSIDQAHLTVTLPVAASGVLCDRGVGADSGCTVKGDGTKQLTVDAEALSANTPITVKVGLDMPTPDPGTSVPWSASLDPVLVRSPRNLMI